MSPRAAWEKPELQLSVVEAFLKYAFVFVAIAFNHINKCWLSVERGFLWDCVRPCRTINALGALSCVAISDLTARGKKCETIGCYWRERTAEAEILQELLRFTVVDPRETEEA